MILLLPSLLTFITLLVHRVRASRAAQRERAPEEFVHRLPWRVWTGNGWEKHESGYPTPEDPTEDPSSAPDVDIERGEGISSSSAASEPAWVDQQEECAICLEMFAKGDRVRVLPCNHMFHLDEVDEWLIQKKKVVCDLSRLSEMAYDIYVYLISAPSVRRTSHSLRRVQGTHICLAMHLSRPQRRCPLWTPHLSQQSVHRYCRAPHLDTFALFHICLFSNYGIKP